MIVTYLKENGQVISIVEGFPKVWEENNQLLIENGVCPLLNNLTKAGWGYYEDKPIERQYDEEGMELPLYMKDLDLTSAERPLSMEEEVAQLKTKVNKLDEDVKKLKLTAEK